VVSVELDGIAFKVMPFFYSLFVEGEAVAGTANIVTASRPFDTLRISAKLSKHVCDVLVTEYKIA
jgi:hypothetical protein